MTSQNYFLINTLIIKIMNFIEEILKELPFAVTVCDTDAKIIYMNERSKSTFQNPQNESLIGKSLFECHGQTSAEKIKSLLETGNSNTYTIEKKGIKKIIHQCPWYKESKISGLMEISIVIPEDMPHYIRG